MMITSHSTISPDVPPHHLESYDIASRGILPHYQTFYRINISLRITSHHFTWHSTILHRISTPTHHMISHHISSLRIAWHYITLSASLILTLYYTYIAFTYLAGMAPLALVCSAPSSTSWIDWPTREPSESSTPSNSSRKDDKNSYPTSSVYITLPYITGIV